MSKIELDVSHEMTLGELDELTRKYNVKAKIATLFGPGGGNPIIEFSGETSNLLALTIEAFELDRDFFLEFAEE